MLEGLLGGGSLGRVVLEHGPQEGAERGGLVGRQVVLLLEHLLQRPVLEVADVLELAQPVEVPARVLASRGDRLRNVSQRLDELRQMICVESKA